MALDRAGFSPGVLDGRSGGNTKKALDAYTKANGGAPPPIEPTAKYRITDADAAGPFEPQIPTDLVEQAKLKTLAYRTLLEALAERYHATPALLQRLNPARDVRRRRRDHRAERRSDAVAGRSTEDGNQTNRGGEEGRGAGGAAGRQGEAGRHRHGRRRATSALTVTDAAGKVIMYAPVTTGSEHDPLPIGDWKVNGVGLNPTFRYNPELFWDADPTHTKAVIPAGPNNPVGLVWIDISKEHYGIHGSPEPANIGRSESHGCVRLSNWDALRLAALVKPGTPVAFRP